MTTAWRVDGPDGRPCFYAKSDASETDAFADEAETVHLLHAKRVRGASCESDLVKDWNDDNYGKFDLWHVYDASTRAWIGAFTNPLERSTPKLTRLVRPDGRFDGSIIDDDAAGLLGTLAGTPISLHLRSSRGASLGDGVRPGGVLLSSSTCYLDILPGAYAIWEPRFLVFAFSAFARAAFEG